MTENTSICIVDKVEIDTVVNKLSKIRQFQELVKSNLADGHDYGIIPGTSKPTLLKPGAEKIIMLMGLTSEFDIIDSTRDFENGFFQYQVKCRLYKDGLLVTEGLAACNTKESKYIKRDAFSIDNTVLKMAKKRAMVDATLLIASLSQIFTQDTEDMEFSNGPVQVVPVPAAERPQAILCITEKQRKRMFAISNGNTELCREICEKYGYKNSADVRRTDYDNICDEIKKSIQNIEKSA